MSLISSVAPNGVASGPLVNVVPVAVAQAAGAAGTGPTAQSLLPTAVTAALVVPAYSTKTPEPPSKPALRLVTTQPSSSLAAQLIAQSPSLTPEQLALFARRDLPSPNNSNPQLPPPAAQPAPASTSQSATLATVANATAQGTPITTAAKPTAKPATLSPLAAQVKRAEGAIARTAAAYQFTAKALRTKPSDIAIEAVG